MKSYSAYVTLGDHDHQWTVRVYSNYKTAQDAADGIEAFKKQYLGSHIRVINHWIEQN